MAQGSGKLRKARKSSGSQKKRTIRSKTATKGRKQMKAKGSVAGSECFREQRDTTKAINRRNETSIAAKAVGAGTNFFLGDIAERGEREAKRQVRERDKKQAKSSNVSDRLKDRLEKLK